VLIISQLLEISTMGTNDGFNRFKRRHGIEERVKKDLSLSFLTKSASKTTVVLQKNE